MSGIRKYTYVKKQLERAKFKRKGYNEEQSHERIYIYITTRQPF